MSVPIWERGGFLGGVLTLLLAVAAHADESARNETSVAKTKLGQVQNVSIHNKTVRAAEAAPLAAVSSEAAPAKSGGAMQAQLVSAAVADGVQPQMLAAVPRFAKADDEAGGRRRPLRICNGRLVLRSTILKRVRFTCRTARRLKPIPELGGCATTPLS